jgi:hypothetical protein
MMRTIPFEMLEVRDDTTFFVAVDCNNRLAKRFLNVIPKSLAYLQKYRLVVILFADTIIEIRTVTQDTVRRVYEMMPTPGGAASIDPLINHVMGDRSGPVQPKLFIFSDGNVTTYWNLGIMAQVVDITWFHDIRSNQVNTPTIGTRFALDLEAPVTKRYGIALHLRYADDTIMLSLLSNEGAIPVATRALDTQGVDFQKGLDELVGIAHTVFHAPATLAEWKLAEPSFWRYQLCEGD